jgi:hypothetical protein
MLKQNDLDSPHETVTIEHRRSFLKLPLGERWKILSRQAEQATHHFESKDIFSEREDWQGGDIVEC